MFEPLTPHTASAFRWDDVERAEYYLTQLGSDPREPLSVKLGAKCTLKNGEKYGNIIQIPFSTLKELVSKAEV